jgi:RHS repeat-associated protein
MPSKYKYNGKEWQDELGLNMTAMDFRQYDNAIGRFNCTDPITHYSESPYHFASNNPVYFNDPTGLDYALDWASNQAYLITSLGSSSNWGESDVDRSPIDYIKNFQNETYSTSDKSVIAGIMGYTHVYNQRDGYIDYSTSTPTAVVTSFWTWEKVNFGKEIISNASAFYGALDNKGGSFRLRKGGSFSYKFYDSNWLGGSAAKIKTYNLSNVLKKGSIALTVVLSVKDISNGVSEDYKNYTQTGTTNGYNTSVATAKVAAGVAVGWAAGAATGAAIGSLVPIPLVGTFVGAVVGGIAGYYASEGAADLVKSAYK